MLVVKECIVKQNSFLCAVNVRFISVVYIIYSTVCMSCMQVAEKYCGQVAFVVVAV